MENEKAQENNPYECTRSVWDSLEDTLATIRRKRQEVKHEKSMLDSPGVSATMLDTNTVQYKSVTPRPTKADVMGIKPMGFDEYVIGNMTGYTTHTLDLFVNDLLNATQTSNIDQLRELLLYVISRSNVPSQTVSVDTKIAAVDPITAYDNAMKGIV